MISGIQVKPKEKFTETEFVLNKISVLLLVFIALLSSCGAGIDHVPDGAVISVGGRSVFSEDIYLSFERFRGDTISVNVFRDNVVARELFLVHAIELGLDQDREVLRLTHERTRERLQSAWMAYSLDQIELEDGAALEFWETMGTGISYTFFYHSDSLLMDSVLSMVRAGSPLSDFAVELIEDDLIIPGEGRIVLQEIHFANRLDAEYILTGEPGDIIDPFPVGSEWRMLQIDSIWTYTPDSFEIVSQQLVSMLLARRREDRKLFLEDSLKTVFNVQVNMDAMNFMAENADESGNIFGIFQPEEEDILAVTWDGGSRDIFSLTENIQGLPPYLPRKTGNIEWLSEYAVRLALFDIEMEEAILLGLDTIPETARLLDSKHWENVLDKYYEVVLAPAMTSDSVFYHEVYQEIREDHIIEESRVFHILFLSSPDRIEAAETMIESGDDILEATDLFEFFPPVLAAGGETLSNPLKRYMLPEKDRDLLFDLDVEEEAIITLTDTTGLWLRLSRIDEERLPTFDDIRGIVVAEANQQVETQVIEALIDSLSDIYQPYIDEEYFEGFYIPAEADSASSSSSSSGSLEVI